MKLKILVTWKRLLLLPIVGLVGALLVGWSGLVSIAANTGHFAPVEWFLHWTMQNAVATQSLPISVPKGLDLSDRALVQRAAGHFASGCAVCHGAPGANQSPAMRAMTPLPPRLEDQVGEWRDRELFWIVRHGIKYSGMPSWTTQHRPDEVWAMVAFLRALPGMSAAEYRAFAFGDTPPPAGEAEEDAQPALSVAGLADTVPEALADCARCHGRDGHGVDAGNAPDAFPIIAGQPEPYLLETLRAYASGRRESGIMTPAAGIHSDAVLAELAAYYSALPPDGAAGREGAELAAIEAARGVTLGEEGAARVPRDTVGPNAPSDEAEPTASGALVEPAAASGPPVSAPGLVELGRSIAENGLPARKLPSCQSCHGAEGRQKNPHYPFLGGQPEWFIATQLQLFKERDRLGTSFAHVMEPIAINLTHEQIDALALYYSRLPPGE